MYLHPQQGLRFAAIAFVQPPMLLLASSTAVPHGPARAAALPSCPAAGRAHSCLLHAHDVAGGAVSQRRDVVGRHGCRTLEGPRRPVGASRGRECLRQGGAAAADAGKCMKCSFSDVGAGVVCHEVAQRRDSVGVRNCLRQVWAAVTDARERVGCGREAKIMSTQWGKLQLLSQITILLACEDLAAFVGKEVAQRRDGAGIRNLLRRRATDASDEREQQECRPLAYDGPIRCQ